jgi:hypothetical protein
MALTVSDVVIIISTDIAFHPTSHHLRDNQGLLRLKRMSFTDGDYLDAGIVAISTACTTTCTVDHDLTQTAPFRYEECLHTNEGRLCLHC